MTFKFYILDVGKAVVTGTNDAAVAKEFLQSWRHYVINTSCEQFYGPGSTAIEIKEVEALEKDG